MKIEFELNQEQAEKVKKMLSEEKKEWVKKGEDYYFLRGESVGIIAGWSNEEVDEEILKRANVYRTREAAEQADRQRLALGAIYKYVRENGIRMAGFNGFIPDWNNNKQKFQIDGWYFQEESPTIASYEHLDVSTNGLVFETVGDRRKVLDNCAKELEDLLKVDYSIIR